MVAVCGSYLFTWGKTSNMQLSQNNLSLQAIWLEVNWSMTDPIYSVSRWLIFFFCCIWHTCNCFCFFTEQYVCIYVTFKIYHKLFYSKTCLMTQPNKQARQTCHCFVLNSHFIQPSECKYVLFVCLSVRLQDSFILLHFRNFGRRFFFRTVEGKLSCATHSTIFAEKNQNYFSRTLLTVKIEIREK